MLTTAASLIACSAKPVQSLETPTPLPHPTVIQLNILNRKIIEKPEAIKEVVPQISDLATDYYCQELNCNSDELARLKATFNFLEHEDFQKKAKETPSFTKLSSKISRIKFVGNISLALGYPRSQALAEGDGFLATYFVPK